MTDLRFYSTEDPAFGLTYVLRGPAGAITFHVGTHIEEHSSTPLYEGDGAAVPCDYIGECWHDGSGLAGRDLRQKWEAADRDDSVVRAVLENWYADMAKDGAR